LTWGGSVGGFGRLIGFEIEFARTADFFQTDDTLGVATSVTTVMGNLVLGGGGVGVRPYVSGGFGLLRLNVNEAGDLLDDLSRNDFGVNAGGGVLVSVAPSFAIRGDVRYFRSLRSADEDDDLAGTGFDLADFRYWRGSVGVVLRF
jgi:opacity protein-like surface antigen